MGGARECCFLKMGVGGTLFLSREQQQQKNSREHTQRTSEPAEPAGEHKNTETLYNAFSAQPMTHENNNTRIYT